MKKNVRFIIRNTVESQPCSGLTNQIMNDLKVFIQEELKKRRRQYLESPALILEHFNIEQQNINAYNGRQLLEMLQNADDAAETATEKKVLVRLDGMVLTIANNGAPFDQGGLESILYSSLSPKSMQQQKIGQKGLGFRSILSWADHITIRSGGINIGFSTEYAQLFLDELKQADPTLSAFLKQKSKSPYPIATLRVPHIFEQPDLPTGKTFDTVISIELKPDAAAAVQQQIDTVIGLPTLVFLNHLQEVDIESPKRSVVFRKIMLGDTVQVSCTDRITNQTESRSWRVHSKASKYESKAYELKIAWTPDLSDKENCIYTWFKTQVRFPFPALLHGSFELTQDRNQLVDDTEGHNRFLCEELAALLVKTALIIAQNRPNDPWQPLKLLNIDFGKIDRMLQEFGFKEKLFEQIKKCRILPTVNNEYITFEETPVFYNYPVAEYLSGDMVKSLIAVCPDESLQELMKSIGGLKYYRYESLIKIIAQQCSNISFKGQAKLLYFLVTNHEKDIQLPENAHLLGLPIFIDEKGKVCSPKHRVLILAPEQSKIFNPPDELDIRFLNPELVANLQQEFNINELDKLATKLEKLGVMFYSFEKIVEMIIEYYHGIKNERYFNKQKIKELHQVLYSFFHNEYQKEGTGKIPRPKNIIRTPVLARRSKVKLAGQVYLGKYLKGNLSEGLFGYDKTKLLDKPENMGLLPDDMKLADEYFRWLGVAEMPRPILKEFKKGDPDFEIFSEFALRNFNYKGAIDDRRYKSYADLKRVLKSIYYFRVVVYDSFDLILKNSNWLHIFQWIKSSEYLRKSLDDDEEFHADASICLDIAGMQYSKSIRGKGVKSFIRWKMSNVSWLPVKSPVKKAAPGICCTSKTITDGFSPFVERPNIDLELLADNLEIPVSKAQGYLELVGVNGDLGTINPDHLYKMLFQLPEADPEGNRAKSIYREIINYFDENKLDDTLPTYKTYLEKGSVLCMFNGELQYMPVKEARYLDNRRYGRNILRRFPLFEADRKSGAKKIQKLFGVAPFESPVFSLRQEPVLHPLNEIFANEILQFKAFVYALRISKDSKEEIKKRILRVKIDLALDLQPEFEYLDNKEDFQLEPFEFISLNKDKHYIIRVPESFTSPEALYRDVDFGDVISEIFAIIIDSEEYRSFLRELFSRSPMEREVLFLRESHSTDNSLLLQARSALEVTDDLRITFWRALIRAAQLKTLREELKTPQQFDSYFRKNKSLSDIDLAFLLQEDTYEQLNELETSAQMYDIFIKLKVDFEKFSRFFQGFNLEDVFKNRFIDIRSRFEPEFAEKLYEQLILVNDLSLKVKYFHTLDSFRALEYSRKDGYIENLEAFFFQKITDTFDIHLTGKYHYFNPHNQIATGKNRFYETYPDISMEIPNDRDIQALLIFDEMDEVRRRMEKIVVRLTKDDTKNTRQIQIGGTTIRFDDRQSLINELSGRIDLTSLKISPLKTMREEDREDRQSDKTRKPGKNTRNTSFSKGNEAEIGAIGEWLAFHVLCRQYGSEKVRWLSENAAFAGENAEGEAGYGYDIEITTKNGEVRFVEVKALANINDGFRLSSHEMKIALQYPEKYDILLVVNPLGETPTLRYVKQFFKIKKGESAFDNLRFRIFNDVYLIKFMEAG